METHQQQVGGGNQRIQVIDIKLMQKPQAFAGDQSRWSDCSLTFRAHVGAINSRMTLLMDHAQASDVPLPEPTDRQDRQLHEQLYFAISILVCDAAMKNSRAAPEGRGTEAWRLLCDEFELRIARRFQAVLSAILRSSLKDPLGPALDDFEREVRLY